MPDLTPSEQPPAAEKDAPAREHHLKVVDPYYRPLATDEKTFEVRKDDRDFQVGDVLHLHWWHPESCTDDCPASEYATCPAYVGSSRTKRVTFVYSGDPRFGGIEPGHVVLGLGEVDDA